MDVVNSVLLEVADGGGANVLRHHDGALCIQIVLFRKIAAGSKAPNL